MWLLSSHEIDVAHRSTRIAGQGRRPNETSRSVAEEVADGNCLQVIELRKSLQLTGITPAITRLVEIESNAISSEINDVGGTRAVDVGKTNALLVELIRVVHGDLGAEAAIAQVGPVADFAVSDAHQVGKTVAGQVGQIDGLRAVSKDQARAFLFVERLAGLLRGSKTVFGQR